jgi:DNA-binding ferritin-like protein (Dps family)
MALTPEQQEQVEFQTAMTNINSQSQMALQARQAKLETVRLAKEVLLENARSKPVESREVTAADITAFAAALESHINA